MRRQKKPVASILVQTNLARLLQCRIFGDLRVLVQRIPICAISYESTSHSSRPPDSEFSWSFAETPHFGGCANAFFSIQCLFRNVQKVQLDNFVDYHMDVSFFLSIGGVDTAEHWLRHLCGVIRLLVVQLVEFCVVQPQLAGCTAGRTTAEFAAVPMPTTL